MHIRPAAKTNHAHPAREKLDGLIARICSHNWYIENLEKIRSDLNALIIKYPDISDLYLWRGIAGRIAGHDTSEDLLHVLEADPDNRLAILNLSALPISSAKEFMADINLTEPLKRVEDYLSRYPTDAFANLIHAVLQHFKRFEPNKTIKNLEKIYLAQPSYAASVSVLAAVLDQDNRKPAALDFAEEALKLDPQNILADNIVKKSYEPGTRLRRIPYLEIHGQSPTSIKLIFNAPYIQQDYVFGSQI